MRIIISESHLQKLISELHPTIHIKDRLEQRLTNIDSYDVVAFSKRNDDKIIIGKYRAPQAAIDATNDIMQKLRSQRYYVPPDIALIIHLFEFKLDINDITFIGSPHDQARYKQIFRDRYNWNIYLRTNPQKNENATHGRILMCLVIGNRIITIFLLANTNSSLNRFIELARQKPENRGVEDYIYIANPETDLEQFVDIDVLKTEPLQKPTEEPQINPQPTMTDKERRLQAYKEKMRRKFGKK